MDILNNLGGDLIFFLQTLGSWLFPIMQFFSFLGYETFYLLVLPIIYWSFDSVLGFQIGLILMLSSSINTILKVVFHSPRPFWVDSRLIVDRIETSFGIPSGHAQNAVAVWGVVAVYFQKTWIWILCILSMFLIGISRMVLGVHFLVDVVTGWMIGGILLYLFIHLKNPIRQWLEPKDRSYQILVVLAGTLILILIGAVATLYVSETFSIPQEWIDNFSKYAPNELFDPYALEGLLSTSGLLFGITSGYIMLKSKGGFANKGSIGQHLLRYLIGVTGVLILWLGLDQIFPDSADSIGFSLRFIRYALVGAWIVWWAPYLFIRFGLAQKLNHT